MHTEGADIFNVSVRGQDEHLGDEFEMQQAYAVASSNQVAAPHRLCVSPAEFEMQQAYAVASSIQVAAPHRLCVSPALNRSSTRV